MAVASAEMLEEIDQNLQTAISQIKAAEDLNTLEQLRIQYLGKKGLLATYYQKLSTLAGEDKAKLGQVLNQFKTKLAADLENAKNSLAQQQLKQRLVNESVDVSLPGRKSASGSLHPVTIAARRLEAILTQLGFVKADGPEIEDDYHNFTALNIPESHPARAMHDTFYFDDGYLLRTHTSNVQIRALKQQQPPARIYSLGRVYRKDSDQTHTPMFHQLEGFVIDQSASFAELKYVLQRLIEGFFAKKLQFRLRPSYFPFTEPSAEMDMSCVLCSAQGCRVCKQTGWLEVLGCGMVHPKVLSHVDIDAKHYQGYAFGLGVDRLAMLYLKINDLRDMFENDLRFLGNYHGLDTA